MSNRRIAIFDVNWLGDVIFSTAVIRNVRLAYPGAFIACIIPPRCKDILADNPDLDEIILYEEGGRHRGLPGFIRFAFELSAGKFDTVFLLHRSMSRALVCRLAGIRQRIGYDTKGRGWLLTSKARPPDISRVHRVDYYLGVIALAGIPAVERTTRIFVNAEDERAADSFLAGIGWKPGDPVVGMHPAGNWGPKRWPKEYFRALAAEIIRTRRAKVVFTGGKEDKALIDELVSVSGPGAFSACGTLSIKQFAALTKRLSVFVTADSGPLHIANAAGAPRILGLFGPTKPELTGPVPADRVIVLRKDAGCRLPCYAVNCPDNRCMKAISVEDVLAAIDKFL